MPKHQKWLLRAAPVVAGCFAFDAYGASAASAAFGPSQLAGPSWAAATACVTAYQAWSALPTAGAAAAVAAAYRLAGFPVASAACCPVLGQRLQSHQAPPRL